MKPIERPPYHDLYILVQKSNSSTGMFTMSGTGSSLNGTQLGTGVYDGLETAQKEQTIQLLKGNHVEIFHIEYPVTIK